MDIAGNRQLWRCGRWTRRGARRPQGGSVSGAQARARHQLPLVVAVVCGRHPDRYVEHPCVPRLTSAARPSNASPRMRTSAFHAARPRRAAHWTSLAWRRTAVPSDGERDTDVVHLHATIPARHNLGGGSSWWWRGRWRWRAARPECVVTMVAALEAGPPETESKAAELCGAMRPIRSPVVRVWQSSTADIWIG